MDIKALLQELGLDPAALGDGDMEVRSPVDGALTLVQLLSHDRA